MDLFSYEKPKYKLPPTVRLFEAFSGIGTQAMALKEITNVEHVGFSEIDKYAIKSYRAIHGDVPNYGDITKMTEIPPCDVFTWSFPCTDLSKAGKQKGLQGTRSGLGFEVMRLLHATKDKPKVLLMENVPDLLSPKFRDGWHEMYNEIESLGYTNYVEILNAKNYGVAQNRDRVFMVSILGDYSYSFPKPFKLEKRLKDYLEDVVDEKYYLSDKQVEQITSWKAQQDPIENAKTSNDEHIQTITAKSNTSMNSSMLLIKEATKQGYAIAEDGDGVYINRPHQKRGVVQKEMIQTIKGSQDVGVVVSEHKNVIESYNDFTNKNGYIPEYYNSYNKVEIKDIAPTVTTNSDRWQSSGTISILNGIRIRKLTSREAWRLMGISDDDFEKAQKVSSNSQLYKQAGNAIVVNVLVEIFKELL